MKNIVILGAGQTGRGFIAPIMKENGYSLTFIDKDRDLIYQLKKEKAYQITYFGNVKKPCTIETYDAWCSCDEQAIHAIAEADILTTSVFASHITELIPLLQKGIACRTKPEKLIIVCCENGVHVKQPLIEASLDAILSEGIIFCTTRKPDSASLDLLCEDYPDLPVDGSVEGMNWNVHHMPLEHKFSTLIQRKIYTYNFISAVVAYLGSYCGYDEYAQAALDKDIANVISKVTPIISRIIAKRYDVTYEEQLAFTKRAVHKFQNKDITDTILRNAQQASRKLTENERLLTPLRFALEYKECTAYFELIIAAAIYYGCSKEELSIKDTLQTIQNIFHDANLCERIENILVLFQEQKKLSDILLFIA